MNKNTVSIEKAANTVLQRHKLLCACHVKRSASFLFTKFGQIIQLKSHKKKNAKGAIACSLHPTEARQDVDSLVVHVGDLSNNAEFYWTWHVSAHYGGIIPEFVSV